MVVKEKRQVQIKIDEGLAGNTEAVLGELGLNPTTAINILYKRAVTNGALPFSAPLSEEEGANLRFLKMIEGAPVTEFRDAREIADWSNDPDGD